MKREIQEQTAHNSEAHLAVTEELLESKLVNMKEMGVFLDAYDIPN